MATRTFSRQTLRSHLQELRIRFLWSVLALVVGSVIGYAIRQPLMTFLLGPLNKPLFYASPAGGLDFVLRVSIFFGIFFSLPVFAYHALKFIAPAVPHKPRFFFIKRLSMSFFLALIGMTFAFLIALPAALNFLSEFESEQVKSLISTSEYFSFVTRYLLGFAIFFQLPLVLVMVNAIHPLTVKKLVSFQKYVIGASFLLAAFVTPTLDVFNQTIMALPIILLYELSIVTVWFINQKKLLDSRN